MNLIKEIEGKAISLTIENTCYFCNGFDYYSDFIKDIRILYKSVWSEFYYLKGICPKCHMKGRRVRKSSQIAVQKVVLKDIEKIYRASLKYKIQEFLKKTKSESEKLKVFLNKDITNIVFEEFNNVLNNLIIKEVIE